MVAKGGAVNWLEFSEELCNRFGERSMANVVEEFNKLRQEGSVIDYQMKFKELRALLWISQPSITEAYFVSSFISGLKNEL